MPTRPLPVRSTAGALVLLGALGAGVATAGTAAAAAEGTSPLATPAPLANAFSNTPATPLDLLLNQVVPTEATAVIAPVVGLSYEATHVQTAEDEGTNDAASASTGTGTGTGR